MGVMGPPRGRPPLAWRDIEDWGYPGVSVRIDDVGGRPRIVGVQVERPGGVTADDLRSLPVHRLEARLDERYLSLRAQLDPSDLKPGEVQSVTIGQQPTRRQLHIPARLFMPEHGGRRYPDEFYRKVAELYSWCVVTGVAPAPAIAAANKKPVATVHRWISEARRRGVLAPARMAGSEG
jgi:hypothetical protein